MSVVELHSCEHLAWVRAENEAIKAQEELNTAAKAFKRAYERWEVAKRYAKKLREQRRKKLQKADK